MTGRRRTRHGIESRPGRECRGLRADAILFSTGKSEVRYSVGFGIAFPSFQLDFATDQADSHDVYSASAVWRF